MTRATRWLPRSRPERFTRGSRWLACDLYRPWVWGVPLAAVAATIANGLVTRITYLVAALRSSGTSSRSHSVELLARADRRSDRLHDRRRGRARGPVARPVLEGHHPGRLSPVSPPWSPRRHLPDLPDQPQSARPDARDHGFRVGQIGRLRWSSLAHGTNDAQKTMGIITLALIANGTLAVRRQDAVLGHPVLRAGDRPGHLPGRLAGDPHPGQGAGRDRVTAGHGGRVVLGRGHPAVQPLRLLAVHHARRHRLDHRHRARQEGAEVRWNVAGRMATGLAVHPPGRRGCRRGRLRARQRDRRQPGRDLRS